MSLRERIDAEYDGIIPYHEIFYLYAIRNAASKSIRHYNAFLNGQLEENTDNSACYEFFSAIMQAANLSTFFWPNPRRLTAAARGERLRSCFDPLSIARIKDRKLRNRIVHLDEFLDDFCAREEFGEIVDGYIGNVSSLREGHIRILRMVDPIEKVAVLYGYEFHYSGYFESVADIGNHADHMIGEGSRLKGKKV